MPWQRFAAIIWVTALMLGQWSSPSPAQSASDQLPRFSSTQADSGRRAYRENCATCHGVRLQGLHLAPSLTGERFDRTWRGKSAGVLSFHLHRMPPESVASEEISEEAYTSILAYILQSNGLLAGEEPLPSDRAALGRLIIPGLEGKVTDPDEPVAGAAERSERLRHLSEVTDEMLRHPSPGDWLQWGRTYDGQSFSPLALIDRETVADLRPAWRASLRGGTSMPMPLVHGGIMFLNTYPDTVLALDASSGVILWRYRHSQDSPSSQKMGLALHGDKVLVPTSDLHVLALSARSGELIWDHEITHQSSPDRGGRYQLRSAPLVVGDKVIQGVAASFVPRGGFIVALDLDSGEQVWRFDTIARPGEPNGNSWNGLPLERRSGGSVWHEGTYDPKLGLVYFGVAPTYDTGPLLHPSDEEGVTNDALYTNCTIALDADTGHLAWHYQHMPNDQWDLDWVFERQIVELSVDGLNRKVVMNTGKMGILEALDAATGEYLFSIDTGVQNVITAIDPKTGRKTIDPEKIPDLKRPCVICPSAFGARSWPPTSFSPRTKLLYVPLTEWCMGMGAEGFKLLTSGVGLSSAPHPGTRDGRMGRLQAIDVEHQTLAWTSDQRTPPSTSMLATAGGLVFVGDLDPSLKAFDDSSGELLWQAELDDLPSSALVSYGVDGTQYVAVVVGLRNNHVRDLSRSYDEFRAGTEDAGTDRPRGGAAIWAFSF